VVTAAEHVLVGPDNGLFTPFLAAPGWRAFEIAEADYRLPLVSRTFHGRDLFAPAAAHLALGLDPARLGPAVSDPVRLAWPEVRAVAGAVAGAVVHTDRFGNLITSIHARSVDLLDPGLVIRVGGHEVPLVGTYADLAVGRPGALVGSGGRLEIAVREGSAAAVLRAQRGTAVVVSRRTSAPRRPRRRR
jgi:S-adenosylmethionine hydrolase